MHKKRRNAGFSLAELLIAVAIVVTLAGFAFVAVAQQRKNLAILEADETAKEIFLAAQEHLSMAALQGRLHSTKDGDNSLLGLSVRGADLGVGVKDDEGKVVAYAVFDDKSVAAAPRREPDAAAQTLSTRALSSASSVMLPQGAIDEFVLNHRYAIRYSAEAYKALEVFYTADNKYVFKYDEDDADDNFWTQMKTWTDGREKVQESPGDFQVEGDSQKPVIMGWYGEMALLYQRNSDGSIVEAENLQPPPQGIKPGLTVINGPILYALVSLDTKNYHYSETYLQIDGAGGSASIQIPPDGDGQRVRKYAYDEDTGISYYMVILDDVTTPGYGFNDIEDSTIPPGSDIQVTVKSTGYQVTDDTTTVNPAILNADSATMTTNSLFANGSSPDNANIQNFRHLQNLNNTMENADEKTTVKAQLTNSIGWGSFQEGVQEFRDSYETGQTGDILYTPLDLDYRLEFDGNNHYIRNLALTKTDGNRNAGVFGTLDGGGAIQNLVCSQKARNERIVNFANLSEKRAEICHKLNFQNLIVADFEFFAFEKFAGLGTRPKSEAGRYGCERVRSEYGGRADRRQ